MGSLADLYNNNVSVLLNTLQTHKTLARYELADITGLTRTTVSKVVAELSKKGIVQEVEFGEASSRGGRKPVLLEINENALSMIGLDLRREKIVGCLVNLGGEILAKNSYPISLNASKDKILDTLNTAICYVMDGQQIPIMGIGVGSIGPVNQETGLIKPQNFESMLNVPLGDILRDQHDLPVMVQTGARAAAVGEQFWAGHEDSSRQSLAFIVVDYGGLGLGVISDNTLWNSKGFVGELGHITIDFNGLPCECGRKGCLAKYASGKAALERVTNNLPEETSDSNLAELAKMAENGDKSARQHIADAGYYLAYGIVDIDRILRPERIVIGSSHDYLARWYMEGVQRHIAELKANFFGVHLVDRIVLAKKGSHAIAFGAAAMQIKHFFDSPSFILEQLPNISTLEEVF